MSDNKAFVLITGASSGIGEACAYALASENRNLLLVARRIDKLEKIKSELEIKYKVTVMLFRTDLANLADIESLFNKIRDLKIDVLINNAGLAAGLSHIDDGDTDDWDRMIDTNVKGLLYVTRAVSPFMVARKTGHIINISSIAGKEVYENGNVYCASKHAVDALSRSMRIDLLKHNIKVTNIAPGMAETEFSLVRFHGDEERANAIYKGIDALKSEDVAEVTYYCTTLPEHVCINDLVITPTAQANVMNSVRKM